MKKRFVLVASLVAALTLTACGGGGDDSTFQGASENLQVTIDATNGANMTAAVANETFVYTSGVSDFGTTGLPTTVTWTNQAANPEFRIEADGSSATGVTEFGSCRFRVTASNFPANSPLAAGKTVVINLCQIRVATRLQPADGAARLREVFLILNTALSNGAAASVSVAPDGTVTINGRNGGTVTVRPLTGGA